jgi:hypothetical protein
MAMAMGKSTSNYSSSMEKQGKVPAAVVWRAVKGTRVAGRNRRRRRWMSCASGQPESQTTRRPPVLSSFLLIEQVLYHLVY